MDNLDSISDECKIKMTKIVREFQEYLDTIDIHSINVKMFENINVLYNDSYTKIKYLASLETVSTNTIIIKPWNPSYLKSMEKSMSNIDINATVRSDGKTLRVITTPPTAKKRLLISEKIKKQCEDKKVKIRSIRQFYNNKLKNKEFLSSISSDDKKKLLNKVQIVTDKEIANLSEFCRDKIKKIENIH